MSIAAGRISEARPDAKSFAYADPPYPGGNAKRHYGYDKEVNHEILVGTLCEQFPDGWALSTSSTALREVLPLCPAGVRVGAWVKPFAAMRKDVVPIHAWEPVIFTTTVARRWVRGGMVTLGRVHDWISSMPPIFVGDNRGVPGCKPLEFCWWILDLLGFRDGDSLHDVFPGSGIMDEAVCLYGRQRALFPSEVCFK